MQSKIKILNIQPQVQENKLLTNNNNLYNIDPSKQSKFIDLFEECLHNIYQEDFNMNLEPEQVNSSLNYQGWRFSFIANFRNFKGKKISGILRFPINFPEMAPKFYFDPLPNGETLQHVNIYGDNTLCMAQLAHWNPKTNPMEILQAIEHVFNNPNWGDGDAPANPQFAYFPQYERDQIQQKQAKLLQEFEKQ